MNEYLTELTRRCFLRLGSATGIAAILPGTSLREFIPESGAPMIQTVTAHDAVDHLILGAADLDAGVAWVEQMTGVKAKPGGQHPGVGTRNALLSLGGRQYLEILALDPQQQTRGWLAEMVAHLTEPRLVTWAAVAGDIDEIAARARAAGFANEDPRAGSRARPDGQTLSWKTLSLRTDLGQAMPFFIQWGDGAVHPASDSPAGCELSSFIIHHPQPARMRAALLKFGITAEVRRSNTIELKAVLTTPKGNVVLP